MTCHLNPYDINFRGLGVHHLKYSIVKYDIKLFGIQI